MRRRRAIKREIQSDPKYNSQLVAKLVSICLVKGEKSLAERIVYSAFDILEKKTSKNGLEVLKKALENARPLLEVKPRRVGGATYQVPQEIRSERGTIIALRWIRNFARARKGKPMQERLAQELLDAYNNEGATIKKKEDTHKMAESNKAFAHFRW
ncbi:MAG: 30S ribosomal protein S7 [Candidatus Omnitrophica bacterium]|nr:30S ribosomal protein S7 [Candidatus Omnitrophota bacterium]MBU1924864.1 30S ribosomal protein S7 [Candidatus Omnitrophota bacterium]